MTERFTTFQDGSVAHRGPELRSMLHALSAGRGIVSNSDDYKVTHDTGMSINVSAGSAVIPSKTSGESYTVKSDNATPTSIVIASTGVSSRSDLVVLRIADEHATGSGFQSGDEPVSIVVIQDVPTNATTLADVPGFVYGGIALARIDLPTETTDLANATIVDLRDTIRISHTETLNYTTNNTTANFPNSSVSQVLSDIAPVVTPPVFARRMTIAARFENIGIQASSPYETHLKLGVGLDTAQPNTVKDLVIAKTSSGLVNVTVIESHEITSNKQGKPITIKNYAQYVTDKSGVASAIQNCTSVTYTITYTN